MSTPTPFRLLCRAVPKKTCVRPAQCPSARQALHTFKTNFTSSVPKTPKARTRFPFHNALLVGAGIGSFCIGISLSPQASFDAPSVLFPFNGVFRETEEVRKLADNRDHALPRFRLSEVKEHDGKSKHPWVTRGDKVYDITDWVAAHPGGKIILTAAGGSIDRYWDLFAIHKQQYVYDILEQYLIGYVHSADLIDGKPPQDAIEDPFAQDPERNPALITRTATPRNAETPGQAISDSFLTPNDLFYVRNHMWVPVVPEKESDAYCLTIEMLDGTTKEYTLKDLKTKFPKRQVTAVLQCSGNRRRHMSEDSGRKTNGLPWQVGAISNASWEGVSLADVLADAGFKNDEAMLGRSEVKHVHFSAMEAYGASIPIKKAVDPQGDVLLAYGMNGQTLPRDHGFPLRTIVPGHVAARSVKWLSHITLSEEESMSQFQRRDYKCFGPNETKVDWDAAPAIQEMPIQSAITTAKLDKPKVAAPSNDQETPKPTQDLDVSGYAFSGGGRSIIRVDISVDNGNSWSQATILPDHKDENAPERGSADWAWKRWKFNTALPRSAFTEYEKKDIGDNISNEEPKKRCTTVVVKATDEVYNTQPDTQAAIWNVRGNLANAWHRMQVCTECEEEKKKTTGKSA
ncbi:hypothetical protein VHEMI04719 [[Torrubiella] hemipterigena]|uniref:Nitrate reductase [NADPH] n=1 Tax=[Torrubiella] hemipterigena TaxID=1531966 RepID=A0A0A1T205_9HYPO|nr:hypothetical protein VHEMI04719 [[Torrubiella] hemipterigena]